MELMHFSGFQSIHLKKSNDDLPLNSKQQGDQAKFAILAWNSAAGLHLFKTVILKRR